VATINISLPDSLKAFVEEQVARRDYRTSSEFVLELIRREQETQRLRDLLLEGAASPLVGPADEAWFDELHQHAVQHSNK
jgi:antitoxin ParD1/3/4